MMRYIVLKDVNTRIKYKKIEIEKCDNQMTVQLEIGKRILVVDDEPDVCFVLKTVLRENGFVVDSYEDPFLALKRFKADLYNLVMLDIRMPGLNGFALYQEIRRLDKKVKICFLTAGENKSYYDVYSDIFSSLSANHFIRKPIDNEGLIKGINEIIVDETATLNRAT